MIWAIEEHLASIFGLIYPKRKSDLAAIYACVTVDGKRAEISLKRQTSVIYWDRKPKKTAGRTPEGKELNTKCSTTSHIRIGMDFETLPFRQVQTFYIFTYFCSSD
ncbi:Arm DNA-binding domain-containing protein [Flavivirga jejuensis]|uniref:Arm DNA-binding domain-containing protein n=1 Tax=Flavivirga jejuensis TaxID=870487 RepID=UPI0031EBB118